jgi:uncharacterized membrane protein YjfL (UPF0719 family)
MHVIFLVTAAVAADFFPIYMYYTKKKNWKKLYNNNVK